MSTSISTLASSLTLLMSLNWASAQGSFQNLGFESEVIVPIPGDPFGGVEADAALPGWTGHVGSQLVASVWNNNVPIGVGTPFISIDGPDYPVPNFMEGSFYVNFGSGRDAFGDPIPVALTQSGQVPPSTRSLTFLASGEVDVSFADQPVSVVPISAGVFGVDFTSFAGQTGELRFEVYESISRLDYVQFSDIPIPEPASSSLLVLGILLAGWRLIGRKSKSHPACKARCSSPPISADPTT